MSMSRLKKYMLLFVTMLFLGCLPIFINWISTKETSCELLWQPAVWTSFWSTYLSAIASFAMVVITWYTLRQNDKQLSIIEKQHKDANMPKLSCSITRSGDYIAVKICNITSVLASNVSIQVLNDTEHKNPIFEQYVETALKDTRFYFQPHEEIVIPLYITYYADQQYEGKVTVKLCVNDIISSFDLHLNTVHFSGKQYSSGIEEKLGEINSTIETKQFIFK